MSEIAAPPAPKRAKIGSTPQDCEIETRGSVSFEVLRLSESIRQYLNVKETLYQAQIPGVKFLKKNERKILWNLCDQDAPHRYLASRVLSFLEAREKPKRENDFCKFVACVIRSTQPESADSVDRGHLELAKIFRTKLRKTDWKHIQGILEKVRESPLPSPFTTPQHSPAPPVLSPERPVALIALQGQVVAECFIKFERELWIAFSTGDYNNVECLVETIQVNCQVDKVTFNVDCQIVAMWFQSLVLMHRDGQYSNAIELLRNAEHLADNSENETILKGRIHQRMAQIYLMMHDKPTASIYFAQAKEELQFVGRGYDKTNMFCREAKILSATKPHRRDDIEKVYELALRSLEKDDPYFLASFPSVTLSKTAFHLHCAFGAKPDYNSLPPAVNAEDIKKAREALKDFKEDEHILIDMRRNEYDFLQAELCRLEGNQMEAERGFIKIVSAKDSKVKNIISLASHRLKYVSQRQPVKIAAT